jgi:hypothetical protein
MLSGLVNLFIFGSKTDFALTCQPALLPLSGVPSSRAHAFLEGVRLDLARLAALPAATLAPLAARFRRSCLDRETGRGVEAPAAWPADIRALATPLYAVGLSVHGLPIYGQWQHCCTPPPGRGSTPG